MSRKLFLHLGRTLVITVALSALALAFAGNLLTHFFLPGTSFHILGVPVNVLGLLTGLIVGLYAGMRIWVLYNARTLARHAATLARQKAKTPQRRRTRG